MRWTVRSSFALGTSTRPRPASSRTPSHGAHVPSERFSGIAMMRPSSVVRRTQRVSSRIARSTPTTAMMGSSVYMWTTYRRIWARCSSATA